MRFLTLWPAALLLYTSVLCAAPGAGQVPVQDAAWPVSASPNATSSYAGASIANGSIGFVSRPDPLTWGSVIVAGAYAPARFGGPDALIEGFALLKPEPNGAKRYRTRFIGSGGKLLHETFGREVIYTYRGGEDYVRAPIIDSGGQRAWTQPVFLDGRESRRPSSK